VANAVRSPLDLAAVNRYLAWKQQLLPAARARGVLPAVRAIVALHATEPVSPYLSLWARVAGFRREMLEEALYERRDLVKVLCMRSTLHAVASDELPCFFQAYAGRLERAEGRQLRELLVRAGMCQEGEAGARGEALHRRVLEVLAHRGPATVQEITQEVPELQAEVRYSVGKSYTGTLRLGSRLVPGMASLGLLVRGRPRGTWRSNLHEYAALADWLPEVELRAVSPAAAQAWLVRRYLAAFGPAAFADVQWWAGFSKGETGRALQVLGREVLPVAVAGMGEGLLMLAEDARRMGELPLADEPGAFFLPALDPYLMGYRDRRRYLAPEHAAKVLDRAGNGMATVWAGAVVVGVWGQREDGRVVYGLFEPVSGEQQERLDREAARLDEFLGGECLAQRTATSFLRALGA
jgi:hypothetical protein